MPLTVSKRAWRATPAGREARNAWLREYRKTPEYRERERERARRRRAAPGGAELNLARVQARYASPEGRDTRLQYQRAYDENDLNYARRKLRIHGPMWSELTDLMTAIRAIRRLNRG